MGKRHGSIATKFLAIFFLFTVAILVVCGMVIYYSQMSIYLDQCEKNAHNICSYLELLMKDEQEDFKQYQDYVLKHKDEILIPVDFDGYVTYENEFLRAFQTNYPDKTLNHDIQINELNDDVKKAFFTYKHAYWLTLFEQAREAFNLKYTYYVVPDERPYYMTLLLDIVREPRKDDERYINIGLTVEQPMNTHVMMWEAYNTGKSPTDYDIFNNEYGHTFAYYTPLVIDDEVIGVICTDVSVNSINRAILWNTLRQILLIAAVLVLGIIVLMVYVNNNYIRRIETLESGVTSYTNTKDAKIAKDIDKCKEGNDEISSLAEHITSMMFELEEYIRHLTKTYDKLEETRKQADVMNELAYKDSLTGIRNKLSYDKEMHKLGWDLASDNAKFGIAVVDLNFLKRINDTYGHEQGNLAIKNLCVLICRIFAHSAVFRIGGDEFAIIVENEDYDHAEERIKEFEGIIDSNMEKTDETPWMAFSAALGYAKYDKYVDQTVENVFRRADKAMYNRKKEMKALRQD